MPNILRTVTIRVSFSLRPLVGTVKTRTNLDSVIVKLSYYVVPFPYTLSTGNKVLVSLVFHVLQRYII